MRIIGGKYGGRKLVAFKASHIRPTTDRVKEVLFNKLQFTIDGAEVLDLFSGTGSLAFESLSRGASRVVAVESHARSVSIIKKNQEMLKVGDELQVYQQDVFRFLKQCREAFDVLLIDPPFTKKIADEVMQALSESQVLREDSEIFIESSSQETIQDQYGSIHLASRKSYGDKFLSHYIFS